MASCDIYEFRGHQVSRITLETTAEVEARAASGNTSRGMRNQVPIIVGRAQSVALADAVLTSITHDDSARLIARFAVGYTGQSKEASLDGHSRGDQRVHPGRNQPGNEPASPIRLAGRWAGQALSLVVTAITATGAAVYEDRQSCRSHSGSPSPRDHRDLLTAVAVDLNCRTGPMSS